jgi:hypothetical protein
MKTKILQLALIMGLLMNASCSNDNDVVATSGTIDSGTASLSITISGVECDEIGVDKVGTRALGSPTLPQENNIFNYLIYVFYPNGTLEKVDTVSTSTLTKTVTNLMAGSKKVVVLANVPTSYANIASYSDLDTAMLHLDTQDTDLSTTGLAMSGEVSTTLVAGSTNTISVPVSRVVAKIKLGGITIDPASGHDSTKFELKAVHIMKARGHATMGVPTINTQDTFYGGTLGIVSTTIKGYLSEPISAGNEACYFYVFPNDNTSNNGTLFTIEGEYEGITKYFSFCINDNVINPNDGTGEYIKRNTVHTIYVTLKKPGGGSTDPEQLADLTDLDVTVVPQDWITIPDQPVEW